MKKHTIYWIVGAVAFYFLFIKGGTFALPSVAAKTN